MGRTVALANAVFWLPSTGGPVRGGATVVTHGDHRIAMSHLILGLAATDPVTVDEPGMIATSFPGFVELIRSLGGDIDEERAVGA